MRVRERERYIDREVERQRGSNEVRYGIRDSVG